MQQSLTFLYYVKTFEEQSFIPSESINSKFLIIQFGLDHYYLQKRLLKHIKSRNNKEDKYVLPT